MTASNHHHTDVAEQPYEVKEIGGLDAKSASALPYAFCDESDLSEAHVLPTERVSAHVLVD